MLIEPDPIKSELRWTRREVIDALNRQEYFDVVVVGGGIHGAAVARLAAFNGLKTALLESADYGSATSSRSSKIAHGGLRYLAMGDLKQVFESVKAREELYDVAQHIVKPYPFLIPVEKGRLFKRIQLSIGLTLYEFFTSSAKRKHRWLKAGHSLIEEAFASRARSLDGCYQYYDGIMSDARLVIETIFAARQEGAHCLNYARVDSIHQQIGNEVDIGWTDLRSNARYRMRAGAVVNCAGPWAPYVGRLQPIPDKVCYSQGSHLLFNYRWDKPALFLPLEGRNRYYFVLPHHAGTLVGTTEREVQGPPSFDPLPEVDEVEEILARLRHDIPEHNLSRETLHYGFAGVRTLPIRSRRGDTSTLSRRHKWELNAGVLTLYGGKYTSAYWTAYEGLSILQRAANKKFELRDVKGRILPGAFAAESVREEILQTMHESNQQKAVENVYRIFGGQMRRLLENDTDRALLPGEIFSGAVRYSLEYEQVETLEDLMRRRLELEFLPGHGFDALSKIAQLFSEYRDSYDATAEENSYRQRIKQIHQRLGVK